MGASKGRLWGEGGGSAHTRKQAGLLLKAFLWDSGDLGSSFSSAASPLGESLKLCRPLWLVSKLGVMLLPSQCMQQALQWKEQVCVHGTQLSGAWLRAERCHWNAEW